MLGLISLALAAGAAEAQAWTITFEVYGGGRAFVTNFPQDTCGSESSLTANDTLQDTCTTPDRYCSLCVYRLRPMPADGYDFVRWEWVTAGEACDNPPPSDAQANDCQFQWNPGFTGNYTVRVYFADTGQPTPNLSGPSGTIADSTPSYSWSSDDPVSSYRCALDDVESTCVSPHTSAPLADGPHTFSVRSTDHLGHASDWASKSFTVDTTPPVTTIGGGPPEGSATQSRAATFQLTAPDAASFACRLDGTVRACGAGPLTLAGLPDGTHTLSVQGTDAVGNQENPPKTRTWTVDNVAPDTTITGGPGENSQTTASSATFTFAGAGAQRFECRVDGQAFGPCSGGATHGLSGLSVGAHSFEVRAIDAAGNVDASPAGRRWTIVGADEDHDGYLSIADPGRADCNDSDPAVHPGAVEIPGNDVDEDCDGGAAPAVDSDGDGIPDHLDRCPGVPGGAFDRDGDGCVGPYQVVVSTWEGSWQATRRGLIVGSMRVVKIPTGGTVEVLCAKAGCKYAEKRKGGAGGTVKLRKLKNRLLRRGERFSIRITAPGHVGRVHTLTVKRYRTTPAGIRKAARAPFVKAAKCLPVGSLVPAAACSAQPPTGP